MHTKPDKVMKLTRLGWLSIFSLTSLTLLSVFRGFPAWNNNAWSLDFMNQKLSKGKVSNELYAYPDEHPRASLWLAEDALVRGEPAIAQEIIINTVEACDTEASVNLNNVQATRAQNEDAVTCWRIARGMADEFIRRGELERKIGQYNLALEWYKLATLVDTGWGDPWYYLGWMYVTTEQWEDALMAFQHGLSLPLTLVGQSDFYYQMGWLQATKIEPPDLRAALESLDVAIEKNQYLKGFPAVASHYQRGWVFQRMGLHKEAISEYEWVIKNMPDYYLAYISLGNLIWNTEQDVSRAEELFFQAITLDGNREQAYLGLARIYRETERISESVDMYRKVLQLNPENDFAREQINELIYPEK